MDKNVVLFFGFSGERRIFTILCPGVVLQFHHPDGLLVSQSNDHMPHRDVFIAFNPEALCYMNEDEALILS